MVYDGNRDLVSDDGNREIIRANSTNFNETLEISTKGHLNLNTSTKVQVHYFLVDNTFWLTLQFG